MVLVGAAVVCSTVTTVMKEGLNLARGVEVEFLLSGYFSIFCLHRQYSNIVPVEAPRCCVHVKHSDYQSCQSAEVCFKPLVAITGRSCSHGNFSTFQ